jgi:hypothetical protein
MPRYLIEALTDASPFSGERVGLSKSKLVDIVDASSPEEAAGKAKNGCSVLALQVGIRFRVTPIDHAQAVEVWARYEHPDAPGERGAQYGDVVVMRA